MRSNFLGFFHYDKGVTQLINISLQRTHLLETKNKACYKFVDDNQGSVSIRAQIIRLYHRSFIFQTYTNAFIFWQQKL